jgi:uncharacterized protein (TIGR04141 family)
MKYRGINDPVNRHYTYEEHQVSIAGTDAVIYSGKIEHERASWNKTVQLLSGKDLLLGNSTASAVLLIPAQPEKSSETSDLSSADDVTFAAWAVTFGMGFQMLDPQFIDPGFGQKVAIRCAITSGLNVISKTTLDERPQMVRSTIPTGGSLRRFGFEELGDFVTRIVTEGHIEGIGDADKPVKVRGADSLSLPLSTTPDEFLMNLKQIKKTLDFGAVPLEFAALENLSAVKNPETKKQLNHNLIKAIGGDSSQIALSYPYEIIDEFGQVEGFKLYGMESVGIHDYLPSLEDLLEPIRNAPESMRLQKLNRASIVLYENLQDEALAGPKTSVKKWLTYQTKISDKRYFLQNNRWYVMNSNYLETVQRQVDEIFNRGPYFNNMPEWPIYQIPDNLQSQKKANAELRYNQKIAESLGGLCLDQKLIYPHGGSNGIEACDVLLKEGIFVHVKHVSSSAPASHLLAQALVATELLKTDDDAQVRLKKRIQEAGGDLNDYSAVPKQVVLVMAKDDSLLTAKSLFTFTKINLLRQDRRLGSMGIKVNIAPVLRRQAPEGAIPPSQENQNL